MLELSFQYVVVICSLTHWYWCSNLFHLLFPGKPHSVCDSFWFLVYREKYVGRAEDSQGTWGELDHYSSNVSFSLYNSSFWPVTKGHTKIHVYCNKDLFDQWKPVCLPFVIYMYSRWLGLSIQIKLVFTHWNSSCSSFKTIFIHLNGGGFPFIKKLYSAVSLLTQFCHLFENNNLGTEP